MRPTGQARAPIVAVGASAGGLAAVTELLRALGGAPGLAIVLIQHLDPTHASSLVELLSKVTSLPVSAIHDGMEVEPNKVYVMPPAVELSIEDGILRLSPRGDAPTPHLPIDLFFESLADDHGQRSMAVVLSGTGGDGVRGVQAIKSAGGITFAQDAAEHDGMPESAMATGCIDFVLTASAIAAELLQIAARPSPARDGEGEPEAFQQILAAIRARTGLDFTQYRPSTLRRRIQRRAVLAHLSSLTDYADLIAREPGEVEALSEEVLIHVTSFFRDPAVFEALEQTVFPRLVADRPSDTVRVWVAGCSSGEEVYSVAIGLLEAAAKARAAPVAIKVFGTDVSRRAIDRARAGVYRESIARQVGPERLARFFVKTERGYEIVKEVRDCCVFATHDVARDPPFSKMDLISCRNLMIYLGPTLQQRILPMFHYALNDPGFLVLGTAETVGSFAGFAVADAKNKIYTRALGRWRTAIDFGDLRGWGAPDTPAMAPERRTTVGDVRKDADRAISAAIAPAGVVVTNELAIVEFRGAIAPYLEPTPGSATLDLLRMVREELRLPLRRATDLARSSGKPERSPRLPLTQGAGDRLVDLTVIPFTVPPANARFFAIVFTDHLEASPRVASDRPADAGGEEAVTALQRELASTREYLQSVIEQLETHNEEGKAANEEILSSNEELQSTNEELQTAKEELQATNEELRTVNDEMVERNAETTQLADDLSNVLSSVAIPILILGSDMRIRRFTPAATKILSIIASDVGRPITDIRFRIKVSDLAASIAEVAAHLVPLERTVQGDDGRWYQLVIRPYRTMDNRIDGTILTVYDIDDLKRGEVARTADRLVESEAAFRRMLTSAAEIILMSNATDRIVFASELASRAFGYAPDEMRKLELKALLLPAAVESSAAAAPKLRSPSRDHAFLARRKDGSTFAVEASCSRMDGSEGPLIVTFLADVSARLAADRQIEDYQEKLRQMAFEAAKVEERERRRIAQGLHDRVSQSLALARIKLEAARSEMPPQNRDAVDVAIDLIATSIEDARTLTFELVPPVLYDLGLGAALSWLADDMERRFGLHFEIVQDGSELDLDEAIAPLVFRAVRELLTNVAKHAKTDGAQITLARSADSLEIVVEDHGAGFDDAATGRGAKTGFGLFSVREQVARLGGSVQIESSPEAGTRVRLRLPVARNDEAIDRKESQR